MKFVYLKEEVRLGMWIVSCASVNFITHRSRKGDVQFVLVVPDRHLIILSNTAEQS